MPKQSFAILTLLAGIAISRACMVSGQDYPSKAISIVGGSPGSAGEMASRIIAQKLTVAMGQSVIVENRPGASGIIAAQSVAKALPDGYTLLGTNETLWLLPILKDNVPYDSVNDFAPISLTGTAVSILVVHNLLPVKSVKALVALAKDHPGQLNYGSGGSGTAPHLSAELFKVMTSVNIVNIPYKGAGPALNGLIGGHVQLMFATAPSASSIVRAGRLRAVAVTSARPSALFPGVPTVAETVPGYESVSIIGIFAPAKTSAILVTRLNREIVRALGQMEVKERFLNAALDTVGSSPEELASRVKFEISRMGKVIKDANIRSE